MKSRHRLLLKSNLISLFFIAMSFMSITLAWFAYSGLSTVSTDIDVKAWYIEFDKNGNSVSGDITISVDEIAPGMEEKNETVNIKNLGDSDAIIDYDIKSIRILDEEINLDGLSRLEIEDKLAHDYPFHININLGKGYALAKNGVSEFIVSITWPLDSLNDEFDSDWGNSIYNFRKSEEAKLASNPDYVMRQPIRIVLSLRAEQYIGESEGNDLEFSLGHVFLYDVVANKKCDSIEGNCLKTYVLDTNNVVSDDSVTLLPDIYNVYGIGSFNDYLDIYNSIVASWTVNNRPMVAEDLLKVISTDIVNSYLIRDGLSDTLIGNLKYGNRASSVLALSQSYNGYFKFLHNNFNFLNANGCYWLNSEYDVNKAYALKYIDDTYSVIQGLDKNDSCNIVPIINVSKENLK